MKTKFTICMILAATQIGFAQENNLWLSLGAGMTNTSSANKNNLMGNGTNLQADAFVPLYRKGWDGSVKGSGFTLGINISGNYTAIKNLSPNNADVASQYQIFGGSLGVASQSESKVSGSFSGLLGIQGRVALGKFNFSPSLNAGYLHFNQKGFVQDGSATINGQQQERDLVRAENQTTNGLVFKPQVKIGYNIGQNFTFFVSPSMSIGPEIKQTVQYLVPQGGFNDRNTYEVKQLANGTWESKTNSSRYTFTEINFGVSVAIGKKKASKTNVKPGGAVSSSYAAGRLSTTPTTPQKAEAQDFNTTRSNRENRLSTNPDTVVTQTDSSNQSAVKSINNVNSMPSRLSMTPTTTRQSQGQNFGEKVSQGTQTDAGQLDNPQQKAGISTSRSQIPRNSGSKGKLNENDSTVTENPQQKAQNNNTIRNGREESEKKKTIKQSQGQNFGEKVASGLQSGANVVGQGASLLGGAMGGSINANLKEVNENTPLNASTKLVYYNDKLYTFTGSDIESQALGNNTIVECDCAGHKITIRVIDGSGTNACREACLKYLRNNTNRNLGSGNINTPQKTEAQDFNTTRSNRERGQSVINTNPPVGKSAGFKNPIYKKKAASTPTNLKRRRVEVLKSNKAGNPNRSAAKTGGRTYTGGRKNEPQGKSINEKGVSGNKPKQKTTPKTKVVEKATSGMKDVIKTNV